MNPSPATEHLFNTPIESGLRALFVLEAVSPKECDLQRLVIYDYLLVHSDDVTGGPEALHPATPLRSGELLVRRTLVEHGLKLLIQKGLVAKTYAKAGIYFTATKYAKPFLTYFKSTYATRCGEISKWIAGRFQPLTDDELREFIHENLGRWGAEFTRESVLWEGAHKARTRMAVVAQLKDRFEQLLKHYRSDMERLQFIAEGDFFLAQLGQPHCPFCGEPLEDHSANKLQEEAAKGSIQVAAAEEAKKIAANVRDLEKTLAALSGEEGHLGTQMTLRQEEMTNAEKTIRQELEPRLGADRKELAEEFVRFAQGQQWRIIINPDGKASLRVNDREDPMAHALARMMAREPYRTNVLNVVRENEPIPVKESESEPDPLECERCGGMWYCTRAEAAALVTASPHWCDRSRCPYRGRTTREPNG